MSAPLPLLIKGRLTKKETKSRNGDPGEKRRRWKKKKKKEYAEGKANPTTAVLLGPGSRPGARRQSGKDTSEGRQGIGQKDGLKTSMGSKEYVTNEQAASRKPERLRVREIESLGTGT